MNPHEPADPPPPSPDHERDQDGKGGRFWEQRKPAAVLKHAILDKHLVTYTRKAGSQSRGGRVVYFDGYAGAGRYRDGSPGSPLIAAHVARQLAPSRRLEAFLCEKDAASYADLAPLVDAEAAGLGFVHRHGPAADHIDQAMAFAKDAPLFALLDPFGEGEPFETVVRLLNRSAPTHWPPTELLINCSAFFIRRVDVNNPKKMANIDRMCGGAWWREVFLACDDRSRATDKVVWQYFNQVCRAARCTGWAVPVRNHQNHEPVYYLLFFTRHPDGFWKFGENVSLAMAEWRRYCWDHGPAVPDHDTLPGMGEDLFDSREQGLARSWVKRIKQNITELLAREQRPIKVADHYTEVMAGVTGLARGTHLREAVKQLHKEGRTTCDGKGPVEKLVIPPLGPPTPNGQ